jgi:hypothetical protein
VVWVGQRSAAARYLLTESGNVVVGGGVASVLSTGAGELETLPFRMLDKAWRGSLQAAPVAAALYTILESPALRAAETLIDRCEASSLEKVFVKVAPHAAIDKVSVCGSGRTRDFKSQDSHLHRSSINL